MASSRRKEKKDEDQYLPATPPAWLIPKSPLDSVFRKRFGGLGDPDIGEVSGLVWTKVD